MPLTKQNVDVIFQGLDLKSDPFKLSVGKFLKLENTIPIKGGPTGILLQKRNGFGSLASLPDSSSSFLTTFNGNLLAVGSSLTALSRASGQWITQAPITEMQLTTLSLVRSSSNQAQLDTALSTNGLVCTVFTNNSPSVTYNYVISDVTTGQNITPVTLLSTPAESPRVFVLGNYFIILYSQGTNLNYIAVPVNNPNAPHTPVTLVTNYSIGSTQLAFDGIVANNNLYVGYNATDGGGAVRATYLNSFLVRQTTGTGTVVASGNHADFMSVTADDFGISPFIWISWYNISATQGYSVKMTAQLANVSGTIIMFTLANVVNIATTAYNDKLIFYYEVSNNYSYGATLPTHFIKRNIIDHGVLDSPVIIDRSVGIASKGFLIEGISYLLSAYFSAYQPSYFLLKFDGDVVAKLAYSNGGGYLTLGLPSVSVLGSTASLGYLIKDLLEATNKSQDPTSNTPVFTQTGLNLASFDFTTDGMNTAEIGGNLNLSGGILWAYDGSNLVEQGFNVWPDNVVVTTSGAGGSIAADTYFYQAIYSWMDAQGNIHRSAPSLAVKIVTTGATSTNTIEVPTLRLTYKNLVKIELYRWATAQQTYYQVTSLTSPTLNDKTVDNVTITDIQSNSQIVGNEILYTTGGVVEDIGPPATSVMTLFKSRLFLVDAEDKNLLWYSKQVIENTPVEMSDLFTIYVAPTIGAQGNTGPITALSAMDDKLIIFKKDAIYYLVGDGPDNTGANNDFSSPVFITSTVGCANQNSIVFMPDGLMFQSDKGIWLLGRDLSTRYIGAPVENFNSDLVLSSLAIPATNQVRFTLNSGVTLLYDYFFNVWGTFTGAPAISSTLYESLHTFINQFGQAFQETPAIYLDGSNPVLISLTTGWVNLAGIQGYERIYDFYLLGSYFSPHKLIVSVAYDYAPASSHQSVITPTNINQPWGGDPTWGVSTPWGANRTLEQWRIHTQRQTCQSFQISIQEQYDSFYGQPAGAGFTLSSMNLRVGLKKGVRPIPAARSVG